MLTVQNIARPRFVPVPLRVGLCWRGGGGFVYQEKLDGQWCVREHGRSILVGELMARRAFVAFDCVCYDGQDVRRLPLWQRLELLRSLDVPVVAQGHGGEFLQAVLAAGGEGIVAKPADAPWGVGWWKCKRRETFDCQVADFNPGRQSVRLMLDGQDVGSCPVFGAQLDRLRVGDVVEVAAHSRTAAGKLRDPRFVRARPDKEPCATTRHIHRWTTGRIRIR